MTNLDTHVKVKHETLTSPHSWSDGKNDIKERTESEHLNKIEHENRYDDYNETLIDLDVVNTDHIE